MPLNLAQIVISSAKEKSRALWQGLWELHVSWMELWGEPFLGWSQDWRVARRSQLGRGEDRSRQEPLAGVRGDK